MAQTEIRIKAMNWWRELSINEQNAAAKKHLPFISMTTIMAAPSFIEDIYRAEHGLEPQKRGAAFNQ